jgi:hypothetical protein
VIITRFFIITTWKSDEFDRRVLLLMDCGAMKDKDWPGKVLRKGRSVFLKLWEKMQKGMTYTISLISYVQLKEDRKGIREEVLEAAKQGDVDTFTIIKSHKNHHAIIDEQREILGYRYCIKLELLKILKETTAALPHTEVNAGNGGVRPYLKACRNLQPLCGIWFGVVINGAVTSSTGTYLNFSDSGFNCVVPWGKYKGGVLVLWQLKMIVVAN